MRHGEQCPVCFGKGKLKKGLPGSDKTFTCHGCNGKGWIEVQDLQYYYNPYIPICTCSQTGQGYCPIHNKLTWPDG